MPKKHKNNKAFLFFAGSDKNDKIDYAKAAAQLAEAAARLKTIQKLRKNQ